MKILLLKLFFIYFLTVFSVAGYFYLADGYSDAFYLRFATPVQNSLILGSSRAAHGIVPAIINEEFKINGKDASIFNYAFALGYSSFGPSYYNSIGKKLNSDSRKGLFILEVNPWTISVRSDNPEDSIKFIETSLPIGSLKKVTGRPNFDYLIDFYDQMYVNIIINKIKNIPALKKHLNTSILHDDGWFEVSVRMDAGSIRQRQKTTVRKYTKVTPFVYNFSNIRYKYLKKTVAYLKERGDVYLVRLPVHEDIFNSENNYMPDFTDKILSVSDEFAVKYIDFSDSNKNVTFTDGNHMWKDSSKKISRDIAREILKNY